MTFVLKMIPAQHGDASRPRGRSRGWRWWSRSRRRCSVRFSPSSCASFRQVEAPDDLPRLRPVNRGCGLTRFCPPRSLPGPARGAVCTRPGPNALPQGRGAVARRVGGARQVIACGLAVGRAVVTLTQALRSRHLAVRFAEDNHIKLARGAMLAEEVHRR